MQSPKLKHYIARYKLDIKLLKEHPENKELLESRIERHKNDIINYVTDDKFKKVLDILDKLSI